MENLKREIELWARSKGISFVHINKVVLKNGVGVKIFMRIIDDEAIINVDLTKFPVSPKNTAEVAELIVNFPDDLIDEVLVKLEDIGDMSENAEFQTIEEAAAEMRFSGEWQDMIADKYRNSGALENEDEFRDAHMFFSPLRMTECLTKEQLRICVLLSSLRDDQKKRYNSFEPPCLPSHFLKMNEAKTQKERDKLFDEGIMNFLRTLAEETMPVSDSD